MDAMGVIPARLGSTRLAKKVLLDINGKPMLQYVWEAAKRAKALDDVIIATDDEIVINAANHFGAKAILTSVYHKNITYKVFYIFILQARNVGQRALLLVLPNAALRQVSL